jgi:hypothetical protein
VGIILCVYFSGVALWGDCFYFANSPTMLAEEDKTVPNKAL